MSRLRDQEIDCDVHVIAGDFGPLPVVKGRLKQYFHSLAKPVVVVLGNHDHYQMSETNYAKRVEQWRVELRQISPRIHLLEGDHVTFGAFRFIGCTWWSGLHWAMRSPLRTRFSSDFTMNCAVVDNGINDTRMIPEWSAKAMVDTHNSSTTTLYRQIREARLSGKTPIVVTHFVPHRAAVDPDYQDSVLTPYFVNHYPALLEQVPHWFFGHTHSKFDALVEGCHLHCNPRGYPSEKRKYDAKLIVEI